MRDDEKMFSLGLSALIVVICLIVLLQVCYRVQNKNLAYVRNTLDATRHDYALAETKFSDLLSGDNLRKSVMQTNPNAVTVSFSKTIRIDDIPEVQK